MILLELNKSSNSLFIWSEVLTQYESVKDKEHLNSGPMEPIGTITQYFPFIDEETRNVLESTMTEASDYYEFVQRLRDFVLSTDSPSGDLWRMFRIFLRFHGPNGSCP